MRLLGTHLVYIWGYITHKDYLNLYYRSKGIVLGGLQIREPEGFLHQHFFPFLFQYFPLKYNKHNMFPRFSNFSRDVIFKFTFKLKMAYAESARQVAFVQLW